MATIIVVTNFSAPAVNAFRYACGYCATKTTADILLANIDSLPVSYFGDGVAQVAIDDELKSRTNKLKAAVDNMPASIDESRVRYKAVIGNFTTGLQELVNEEDAKLVVMGTPSAYGEIYAWDTDILNALINLSVPVLTVPGSVSYKPITNIAFACVPSNINSSSPLQAIKRLVTHTGAKLHVVTVIPPGYDENKEEQGNQLLHSELGELQTEYHKIYQTHIVQAIGNFVEEHKIDLLLVRPKKHGIWYNLFHKSHSKELARLNLLPVMALHDQWNVS